MHWYESMPAGLPEGRLVTPYEGDTPVYWLATEPAGRGLWANWRERHRSTGLWPLLVIGWEDGDDPFELDAGYDGITTPEQHEPAAVLAELWASATEVDPDDDDEPDLDHLRPIGVRWPGVAAAPAVQGPPDGLADRYADLLAEQTAHLALVPAADGAHALSALGWTGPANHEDDTAKLGAVVRDWQRRFGARVVGLGFDTLHLSVAAPPASTADAQLVAAEHFAFCPDNIWQSDKESIRAYAKAIKGRTSWTFWWD